MNNIDYLYYALLGIAKDLTDDDLDRLAFIIKHFLKNTNN